MPDDNEEAVKLSSNELDKLNRVKTKHKGVQNLTEDRARVNAVLGDFQMIPDEDLLLLPPNEYSEAIAQAKTQFEETKQNFIATQEVKSTEDEKMRNIIKDLDLKLMDKIINDPDSKIVIPKNKPNSSTIAQTIPDKVFYREIKLPSEKEGQLKLQLMVGGLGHGIIEANYIQTTITSDNQLKRVLSTIRINPRGECIVNRHSVIYDTNEVESINYDSSQKEASADEKTVIAITEAVFILNNYINS